MLSLVVDNVVWTKIWEVVVEEVRHKGDLLRSVVVALLGLVDIPWLLEVRQSSILWCAGLDPYCTSRTWRRCW